MSHTIETIMEKVKEYGEAKFDLAASGWEGINTTQEENDAMESQCADLFIEIRLLLESAVKETAILYPETNPCDECGAKGNEPCVGPHQS